jgi:BTB/POZ domain
LSARAVMQLLGYFYTGQLTNNNENERKMFALALKLKVDEIIKIAKNMVLTKLDDKNA